MPGHRGDAGPEGLAKQVAKPRDKQTQADRYGVVLDKLAAQADGYADLQALFNQASGHSTSPAPCAVRGGAARTRSPSPAWPPPCCTGLPRRSLADGPVQRVSVAARYRLGSGGNNDNPGCQSLFQHKGTSGGLTEKRRFPAVFEATDLCSPAGDQGKEILFTRRRSCL
jgi:hypothetical protein